jgi:hypothetical protein
MKRKSKEKFVPLHQLPDFVKGLAQNRILNHERRLSSHMTEVINKSMLDMLQNTGCEELIRKGKQFLNDEGYRILISQLFKGSMGYDVAPVSMNEAVALLERTIIPRLYRAPSAMHFMCLLDLQKSDADTKLFKIEANAGAEDAIDLVMVSPNGSFACTDPFFAQMGMPCRRILAVHKEKYCDINVLLHFHPLYHSESSKELSLQDKLAETAHTKNTRMNYEKPKLSSTTSWSWAQSKVTARATEVVLGGEAMAQQIRKRPRASLQNSPSLENDRKTKAIHRLRSSSCSAADVERFADEISREGSTTATKKRKDPPVLHQDKTPLPSKRERKTKRKLSGGETKRSTTKKRKNTPRSRRL